MQNLKFDANGLITAVVQDAATKDVLMVAWMNAEVVAKDTRKRRNLVLEPVTRRVMAQGRNLQQCAEGCRSAL